MSFEVLSETESAKAAGVSVETLREYRNLGLLRAREEGGKALYAREDISALFGAKFPQSTFPQSTAQAPAEPCPLESVLAQEPELTDPPKPERPVVEPVVDHSYDLVAYSRTLREQIEMLREERDWLRKRIEVLESRSEKDHQLLLLAESRRVAALIEESKTKRRWRLPFFL